MPARSIRLHSRYQGALPGLTAGHLAGAYCGVDAVSEEWRARLARADEIAALAQALGEHALVAGAGN